MASIESGPKAAQQTGHDPLVKMGTQAALRRLGELRIQDRCNHQLIGDLPLIRTRRRNGKISHAIHVKGPWSHVDCDA